MVIRCKECNWRAIIGRDLPKNKLKFKSFVISYLIQALACLSGGCHDLRLTLSLSLRLPLDELHFGFERREALENLVNAQRHGMHGFNLLASIGGQAAGLQQQQFG